MFDEPLVKGMDGTANIEFLTTTANDLADYMIGAQTMRNQLHIKIKKIFMEIREFFALFEPRI